MSTCNRLELQILGSQPGMPKNLPDHYSLCNRHSTYLTVYGIQEKGSQVASTIISLRRRIPRRASCCSRDFQPITDGYKYKHIRFIFRPLPTCHLTIRCREPPGKLCERIGVLADCMNLSTMNPQAQLMSPVRGLCWILLQWTRFPTYTSPMSSNRRE